jgi:predicted murein hydrolase (TIGR00659 family)
MTPNIFKLWVYLSTSPLFGLTATLLAYLAGLYISERARLHPLANPVAIAIALLVPLLWATRVEYPTYFEGAQFVHFLLGPATVALAVPLLAQLPALKRYGKALILGLLAGGVASAGSAVAIAWLLGASEQTVLSLTAKSVTAPIAMGISEQIGATPALTAIFCVVSGIFGAISGRYVFDALRLARWTVRGFAIGTAAHGIGTARAFQVSTEAGAFAGLALGLHGLIAAVAIPAAVALARAISN